VPATLSSPAQPPAPVVIDQPGQPSSTGWWLALGLFAAAVAGAALLRLRRHRRVALTRAMVALNPRLETGRSPGSMRGLALEGPAIAIRARLEVAAAHG